MAIPAQPELFTKYCPRCDRPYASTQSEEDALTKAENHVKEQHPDHDPNWSDIGPETIETKSN